MEVPSPCPGGRAGRQGGGRFLERQGRTEGHRKNVRNDLAQWAEALFEKDLRGLWLQDLKQLLNGWYDDAKKKVVAKRHRIAAIESFFSWLREEDGDSMRDVERLYAAIQGGVQEVRLEGDGSRPGFPCDLHPGERSMSEGSAWRGNWKVRVYERVRERGYDSLTAFAEARPSVPLVELAEELGEDDIAAAQLFSGLVDEAERSHQVSRLVRGHFVREFSECLPDGWPTVLDDEARFAIGRMRGLWIAFTPETHKDHARQLMAALRAAPPPPSWRPRGPDDELLRMLLPDE